MIYSHMKHYENICVCVCTYKCVCVFLYIYIYIYIYINTGSLTNWVECSPMVRETEVQSQVTSYQRL